MSAAPRGRRSISCGRRWGSMTSRRINPGDDHVDVVGLSVFGLQPWEEQSSAARGVFARSSSRATSGRCPSANRSSWPSWALSATRTTSTAGPTTSGRTSRGLTELVAVIYFNQTEVYPLARRFWPAGLAVRVQRAGLTLARRASADIRRCPCRLPCEQSRSENQLTW